MYNLKKHFCFIIKFRPMFLTYTINIYFFSTSVYFDLCAVKHQDISNLKLEEHYYASEADFDIICV